MAIGFQIHSPNPATEAGGLQAITCAPVTEDMLICNGKGNGKGKDMEGGGSGDPGGVGGEGGAALTVDMEIECCRSLETHDLSIFLETQSQTSSESDFS